MVTTEQSSPLHVGSLRDFPDTARLIGEFIVRRSLAEACLLMPMLLAMNSHNQEVAAAILASTNSTEGKINLVRNAIKHAKQERPQINNSVIEALNQFVKLCDERNALSHHLWAIDGNHNNVVTIDYRKTEGPDRIKVRSDDYLKDLANRTVEVAYRLCESTGSMWITNEMLDRLKL